MNEQEPIKCSKCDGDLERRPKSFACDGHLFDGSYCSTCNSLWLEPDYGFMEAVKNSKFDNWQIITPKQQAYHD